MPETTINPAERVLTASAGAALLVHGLSHRRPSSVVQSAAGAALLIRSMSPPGPPRGQGPVAHALGIADDDGGTPPPDAPETQRTLTIDAPAADLYERFRSGADLPAIWGHLADISPGAEQHTQWKLHGPLGRTWTWETELVAERDGEMLRWRSIDGADLATEGTLTLRPAPGELGTEATLHVRFSPPAGAIGKAIAERLDIVPKGYLGTALRRWKALVETGEIPTTGPNPAAR